MNKKQMVQEINVEIANLQHAATALIASEAAPTETAHRGPGRPAGPSLVSTHPKRGNTTKKRTMSPEGRAKIAAAQKKRWAGVRAEKKAAAA